ncbi:MAG: hypothetical protein ACI9LM_005529 [Alteromonadaceae bacterium]|jgi:hypothetical protein
MFKLILLILGILIAAVSESRLLISGLLISSLVFVLVTNRDNPNIFHLFFGFITVKLLELIIFENFIIYSSDTLSSMWINTIIISIHFVTDLFLYFFVRFRAPLTRRILSAKNKSIDNVYMYQAEFGFMSLLVVFILVDLSAWLENFMRHLDELGFSAEIAEKFSHWTWVYYHYADIKGMLAGLSFILLWSMLSSAGRQKYIPPRPHKKYGAVLLRREVN